MNPLWKVYKSKVMKTLNPEMEEDVAEEVQPEVDMSPIQDDEGPNAVSQLAKKMQGASVKGWKSVTALFNKEDEHQLLESETETEPESQPEPEPIPDHPLAVRPEEPRPNKRMTGFWDSFATKLQQAKQAQAAAAAAMATEAGSEGDMEAGIDNQGRSPEMENQEEGGGEVGAPGEEEGHSNSFSKYTSLGGGGNGETALKWNFVTSKLAELKTKSMAKTN
ncbi:uncharacterized protein C1orf232 [Alosa alosa]|uniref:uncharacterized protein C1orf232 n=1 Tax=Alosa sapidissima TaxID=34773 RepID=UPI001C091B7A|nr:uncharacterized protein C1orf232 [Alosa sapidissima]XP_048116701.1 uncharacterized protein C1orf232 [Alosa alosa]